MTLRGLSLPSGRLRVRDLHGPALLRRRLRLARACRAGALRPGPGCRRRLLGPRGSH